MQNYEKLIQATIFEAKTKYTPKTMAEQLGIDLTPEAAAELVKKYLTSNIHEAKAGPKARQLAAIAALLALGFINAVQAQNKPLTVKTPWGEKTYDARELKTLKKTDPKTFAIIMEIAQKKNDAFSKALFQRAMGYSTTQPPTGFEQTVKNVEILSDDFGNEGKLTEFSDGTKKLEGDIIKGGLSFRKVLEDRGELIKGDGPYAKKK